ncbi:MAG: hypothetical protein ACUVQY_11545 [Thermoproteota archaeon]
MGRSFYYKDLVKIKLKSYRNGNWRKLSAVERALFNASIELAKLRRAIMNPNLVERLRNMVSRLLQTAATRILQMGMDYANFLLELYSRNGALEYFPSIKNWLKDPRYLLWLGARQFAMRSLGICTA